MTKFIPSAASLSRIPSLSVSCWPAVVLTYSSSFRSCSCSRITSRRSGAHSPTVCACKRHRSMWMDRVSQLVSATMVVRFSWRSVKHFQRRVNECAPVQKKRYVSLDEASNYERTSRICFSVTGVRAFDKNATKQWRSFSCARCALFADACVGR